MWFSCPVTPGTLRTMSRGADGGAAAATEAEEEKEREEGAALAIQRWFRRRKAQGRHMVDAVDTTMLSSMWGSFGPDSEPEVRAGQLAMGQMPSLSEALCHIGMIGMIGMIGIGS